MSFNLSSDAALLKLYFLYLQGSVVVLGRYSDWNSAPEDADLQTFCPEPPFIFAFVLSIFFAVRYEFNHNSKKQIKNNEDKSKIINAQWTDKNRVPSGLEYGTLYLSGCWWFLLVLHAGHAYAGNAPFEIEYRRLSA